MAQFEVPVWNLYSGQAPSVFKSFPDLLFTDKKRLFTDQ